MFYKPIAAYYEEIFPLKPVKTAFAASFLTKKNSRVLDIGCAVGELPAALAGRGRRVTGIDLDDAMIQRARNEMLRPDGAVDFFAMDMMTVGDHFESSCFDLVLCLGNTLVHLPSLEAMAAFMKGVAGLLKPGGVFALQIVNYDAVLGRDVKELPVLDGEHVRFERFYRFDEARHRVGFRSRLTVKETGETVENEVSLYPLTSVELQRLAAAAGFTEAEYFGDFKKSPYTPDSPALIAALRRTR